MHDIMTHETKVAGYLYRLDTISLTIDNSSSGIMRIAIEDRRKQIRREGY